MTPEEEAHAMIAKIIGDDWENPKRHPVLSKDWPALKADILAAIQKAREEQIEKDAKVAEEDGADMLYSAIGKQIASALRTQGAKG